MAKEKSRFFTFLLYPDGEGFPTDWEDRLERIGVPIAISPLHDKDKAKGGGYKKRHYHGIYIAKNPVTSESVRNKLRAVLSSEQEECKAVALVQIIHENVESVYLYLTHDSKDAIKKGKYRYDKKDIKHINNFDIERYITVDVETKNMTLRILINLIRRHGIPNVIDLQDFIEANGMDYGIDENLFFAAIENKTSILKLYFDAAYQKYVRPLEKNLNKEED
ncbi:Rep family protein [Streptococcus parasanguinis]|uniref:Rep family protein n=1 Tax=Streptococcus parasanguinis TaxID=1318 RepID=UPI00352E3968